MRRIDVDKVLAEFPVRRNHHDEKHGNMHFINGIETVMEYLDEIADTFPIEAEPVRHGEWTEKKSAKGIFDYYFVCSECHKNTPDRAFLIAPDYCPNCGAKMDEM